MKKAIALLFLALFVAGYSYGQFSLGGKLGYNANALTTNLDSIKDQINSGFHIGAWARIGKRLYLSPEVDYTMSGGVFTEEGTLSTSGWKQKIRIGSVDVPLLLGLKIIHSGFITWRIEVGPEASFIINKKVEDETSVLGPIQESSINSTNWYVIGGTGIDMLFLSLDVRYRYGLNEMIGEAGGYQFNTQNNMFLVSLGIKIFGKK